MNSPRLAIVIPCYNEEQTLPKVKQLFAGTLADLVSEGKVSPQSRILFVDDGSNDGTWREISDIAGSSPNVSGIRQSRNRGHQMALWAGMTEARSKYGCDCLVTIDCDGQDDVGVIRNMVDEFIGGADVVYGVRKDRSSDSFFKRATAACFYRFLAALGVETVPDHADCRLLSARAADALLLFRERNLYLRGLVPLVGFRSAKVFYKRERRIAGESHYPFLKMLSFASDGIFSMSTKPVRIIILCGIVLALIGVLAGSVCVIRALCGTAPSSAAVISSVVALVGGLNLAAIGIVGEYVGRCYTEVKDRPRVLISDRIDNENSLERHEGE